VNNKKPNFFLISMLFLISQILIYSTSINNILLLQFNFRFYTLNSNEESRLALENQSENVRKIFHQNK